MMLLFIHAASDSFKFNINTAIISVSHYFLFALFSTNSSP